MDRLRRFLATVQTLVESGAPGAALLAPAEAAMAELVAADDWLPDAFAEPGAEGYRQYLLHGDPLERFSLVSFVWGPGQKTPVHDHTVWGVVGQLRGRETSTPYRLEADGTLVAGAPETLEPGQVVGFTPDAGDIHAVENPSASAVAVSIHLYGGNIGTLTRSTFDPATGAARPFVSGYTGTVSPNPWAG